MDFRDYCRDHLAEHLDANGDLAPPWEEFPECERHSIGWRMGAGESWLGFISEFLNQLPKDFDVRLAYLRRHAKAPHTWSDWVHDVLYPDASYEEDDDDEETSSRKRQEQRVKFIELGLVESDVAYFTWRAKRDSLDWPWKHSDTPEAAAYHWTRPLWFWSRHLAEVRAQNGLAAFDVPEPWREIAEIVRTGESKPVVVEQGLLSLTRCLAAGNVVAPWQIGLEPAHFSDSFEMDMGYVDAFRLWGMSSFDDQPTRDRFAQNTQMPDSWKKWMNDEMFID